MEKTTTSGKINAKYNQSVIKTSWIIGMADKVPLNRAMPVLACEREGGRLDWGAHKESTVDMLAKRASSFQYVATTSPSATLHFYTGKSKQLQRQKIHQPFFFFFLHSLLLTALW